ncbi:MAG: LysE family translocator [Anaerolineae bacterium]|nr:LysE family translocator [Anaerolineae bacterium]
MPGTPDLLFRGIIIGFSIAAPVGPIGVLVIRRTLADGRINGLVSGLGAATADAIYGTVAGFGLTVISHFLIAQSDWLRLFGGGFLVYLGIKTFLARPAEMETTGEVEDDETPSRPGLLGAYASTFLLTITNPLTILSFAGVLAGLGIGETGGDPQLAMILVLGVFTGSALWWLALSTGIGLFRHRVKPVTLQWVNRISGLVITGAGLFALSGLIRSLLS